MKKSSLLGTVFICVIGFYLNANAVVVNTLNGVDYEWLELTATQGMSRDQVEAQLADVNSALYGYEYASRALIQSLFLSYSAWDGLSGLHGASAVVSGVGALINDFGPTLTESGNGVNRSYTTVDNFNVVYDGTKTKWLDGLMGTTAECGALSCRAFTELWSDTQGVPTMAGQYIGEGWDAAASYPLTSSTSDSRTSLGSYLVKVLTVPVIDPSADVADDAVIGDGSTVGENANVETGVVIGNNSTIDANVTVNKDAELGDAAVVGEGSIVNKSVSAGNNLILGMNVVIDKNVMIGDRVIIGDNSRIGQGTVIGNDVQIGLIGGSGVLVGKNVVVGSNQVVGDGETISAGTTVP